MHFLCANIFGAIVLKPRFKIDVVIMIIWSIVIIINSVLTLQVSNASLPPRLRALRNKGCVQPHLICFIPAFSAGSHRVRVCLSGLINGRNQCNSWGFPQAPHSGLGLCRTSNIKLLTLGSMVSAHHRWALASRSMLPASALRQLSPVPVHSGTVLIFFYYQNNEYQTDYPVKLVDYRNHI